MPNINFIASDGTSDGTNATLWASDGTNAGTRAITSLGKAGSELVAIGGTLFFAADDGVHGRELWKSNGTAAGTQLVADITPGFAASNPTHLINNNGTLFFVASDGSHGAELWKSNGTSSGTVMVADINAGAANANPIFLTSAGGKLFFSANDGSHGLELWTSDGATGGTHMVADLVPGTSGSSPQYLTNVSGTLFFLAGALGQRQLWRSDGTSAGTFALSAGTASAQYDYNGLANLNGTVFFDLSDSTHGNELWKSDGTPTGTSLVKDINPGPASSSPVFAMTAGGKLYFEATDGSHGYSLWVSDGSSAGTSVVSMGRTFNMVASSNLLFFQSASGLMVTDGTAAGTRTLLTSIGFAGIPPNGTNGPVDSQGTLFFLGTDKNLWKSDGTVAGTVMVNPIEKYISPIILGVGASAITQVGITASGSVNDTVGNAASVSVVVTDSGATSTQAVSITAQAANGSVVTSGAVGQIVGNHSANMTISGSIADVNSDLASLSFIGANPGSGSVTLTASDASSSASKTVVVTVSAASVAGAVTVDFEQLPTFAGIAQDIGSNSYSQGGFTLSTGTTFHLTYEGPQATRYTGSKALTIDRPVTLTRDGGGHFSFSSFQLADANLPAGEASAQITGTLGNGSTVTQTVSIPATSNPGITASLGSAFQDVTSVVVTPLVHSIQVDNLVLAPIASQPSTPTISSGAIVSDAIAHLNAPWGGDNCTGFIYTVSHDVDPARTFFDPNQALASFIGPVGRPLGFPEPISDIGTSDTSAGDHAVTLASGKFVTVRPDLKNDGWSLVGNDGSNLTRISTPSTQPQPGDIFRGIVTGNNGVEIAHAGIVAAYDKSTNTVWLISQFTTANQVIEYDSFSLDPTASVRRVSGPFTLYRLDNAAADQTLTGGSFNDQGGVPLADRLGGGIGNDLISGGSGDDTLWGGDGNDTLVPGPGNDSLDGGTGNNIAVFSGSRANFSITTAGSVTTVRDQVGQQGVDALTHIQLLQFDDQTVSLSTGLRSITATVAAAPNGSLPTFDHTASVALDLGNTKAPQTLTDLSGDDQITLGGAGASVTAIAGNSHVVIPSTVTGTNSFTAQGGNHTVTASGGVNTLTAGTGSNAFSISGGSQTAFTGSGDVTIDISGGASTIVASQGTSTITASGGSELLGVLGGSHQLLLNAGAPVVIMTGGSTTLTGTAAAPLLGTFGGTQQISAGSGGATVFSLGASATISGGTGFLGVDLVSGQAEVITGTGTTQIVVNGGTNVLLVNGGGAGVAIFGYDPARLTIEIPQQLNGRTLSSPSQIPVSHDSGNTILDLGPTSQGEQFILLVGTSTFNTGTITLV